VWTVLSSAAMRSSISCFPHTRVDSTLPGEGRSKSLSLPPHTCGQYLPRSASLSRDAASPTHVWTVRYPKRVRRERLSFPHTRVDSTLRSKRV